MSYFDKKVDVPIPGPLSIHIHTIQESGYEKEVPNPMWVSKWLAEIFYMLDEWNEPFENYEVHLWSQFRPDNPLLGEANGGKMQSGLTRPGITLLNSDNYYGPNDEDSINFQRLLSHEFGHQYWFFLKMYDTAQKAPQVFYSKYLQMRGLDPKNASRNVEIWAEDFKFTCGSYKAHYSFDPVDLPSTEKIPGLCFYIRFCHSVIHWLQYSEKNIFDSLTYTITQNGSFCYWMWKHNGIARYSSGDSFIYELQNNQWVIISSRKSKTANPVIEVPQEDEI